MSVYSIFNLREEVFLNGVRKLTPSLVPTERGQMYTQFQKIFRKILSNKKATYSIRNRRLHFSCLSDRSYNKGTLLCFGDLGYYLIYQVGISTLFNQFISLFNQGVEYIGSFLVSKVYVKISSFHLHALLCLYYIRKNTLSQMCKKIRL